jgi:undecaprenyl-phosphate 4-deoxy-4-formamido-L-arabinose transferase
MINGTSQKKLISIIIPCYKSANFIEKTVRNIIVAMDSQMTFDYQIILVNDSSPDDTFQVIKDLCSNNQKIVGLTFTKNFGKAMALLAGVSIAKGDIVVFTDDDGQHPSHGIIPLVSKIEEGYDVCFAKFTQKKHSPISIIGSKANTKLTQTLYELPNDISTSAFFAISRIVAEKLKDYKAVHPAFVPYILSFTRNFANIEIPHNESFSATSRFTFKKRVSQALRQWFNFSAKPLEFVSTLGIIASGMGILFGIFIVCRKLFFPVLVLPGYSSQIAIQLFTSGLILLSLGLIGKTIINIYSQMINLPQYVVKETVQQEMKGTENEKGNHSGT